MQLNLQHSRVATANLTQIILQYNIGVPFVQEPYTILNKVAGFPKGFKIFTRRSGRKRSAIIVNNDIDVIAITQGSHEDAILTEFIYQGLKFYGASLYIPIDQDIEWDLGTIEEIIRLTKGEMLLLALDKNARSKIWSDTYTNARGRALEEYIITRDLLIMNEDSDVPTFESSRGRSWIDLTLCNNTLAQKIGRWSCGEEVSCADHNIIFFEIDSWAHGSKTKHTAKRYNTKAERRGTFAHHLARNLRTNFDCSDDTSDWTVCDNEISQKIKLYSDTDQVIRKFTSAITAACDRTFQATRSGYQAEKKRSVPWWTKDLTLLRKKTLALRRRFQRTKNDDKLRLERRQQYLECNRIYQTKLREEKLQSWKDFCSSIESSNPWNGVYRYAAGKLRSKPILTTLKTGNNSYTTDMQSTINQMTEHFVPEDSEDCDDAHHKRVRLQVLAPLRTTNDEKFTRHEVQVVLEKFDPHKAPGEDALSSEILLHAFRIFPTVFTEIYNVCLRRGQFPKQWKRSVILPIV